MRALTGYDRVTLTCGDRHVESSRGAFAGAAASRDLPILLADSAAEGVPVFPRRPDETSVDEALLRAPDPDERETLAKVGIRSLLRIAFEADGTACEFCCESRTPREPSFELHAAAELFAQMFAMRLAMDQATIR